MRGKVGGLSPPCFKSRGAIAPLAPLRPPPLLPEQPSLLSIENILILKLFSDKFQLRSLPGVSSSVIC